MKTYVVGTHKKGLIEVLLMSTHNICLCAEIRKVSNFLVEKVGYLGLWKSTSNHL